jgi:hypothetical protein
MNDAQSAESLELESLAAAVAEVHRELRAAIRLAGRLERRVGKVRRSLGLPTKRPLVRREDRPAPLPGQKSFLEDA